MEDLFLTIVSVWLMGAFLVHVTAAYMLTKAATGSQYRINALNERAVVATKDAGTGFLLAVLGANRIFDWHLNESVVLSLLSLALMIGVIPSALWIYMFLTNRFGYHGEIKKNGSGKH